jgi:DDE domain
MRPRLSVTEPGGPAVSDVFLGRATGCPIVAVAAPARRPGRVALVVVLVMDPARLSEQLRAKGPPAGAFHTVNPRTITVDKNAADPCAVAEMKEDGKLWRFARLRQCKFLNNMVEQDHRRVKRLIRPDLGFGSFHTARRTLAVYEVMAMVRKGQVRSIGGRDMQAQASFMAELFQVAR